MWLLLPLLCSSGRTKTLVRHTKNIFNKHYIVPCSSPLLSAHGRGMECMFRNNKHFVMHFIFCPFPYCLLKQKKLLSKFGTEQSGPTTKAYKSGLWNSPLCYRCEDIETMEYSKAEISCTLTASITQYANEYTAWIELPPKEIIYKNPIEPNYCVCLTIMFEKLYLCWS
jgi:hypothetical protein